MISISDQQIFESRGQRCIRWIGLVLLICGVLALSYVGLTLLDAKTYQERAEMNLEKQIQGQKAHLAAPPKQAMKKGDVLGRIEIPRIGLSVAILEGTGWQTLEHGVGHMEGTALPGDPGNVGIAGHRDTYFHRLQDIRAKDEIQIRTAAGVTRYDVDWIQITDPSDGAIVSPGTESTLTLVTCYPFHYIGSAPERFVVHAHRQ